MEVYSEKRNKDGRRNIMYIIKTLNEVSHQELDMPLWMRYEPNQEAMPFHSHEFVELVVVTHGTGIHRSHYSAEPISVGSVLAIPRGGSHCYEETNQLRVMNILFDPATLPLPRLDLYSLPGYSALFLLKEEFFSNSHPYPSFRLTSEQMSHIQWLLNAMCEECAEPKPGHKFCLLGIFMLLLGSLSRYYYSDTNAAATTPFQLSKVISYLNTHYAEPITLDDILSRVPMSRSTLRRNFLRATGTNPIDYLLKLRFDHACSMLRESEQSVSEIALAVGFNDSNYFTRIFRKFIGVTPRDYRWRYRFDKN